MKKILILVGILIVMSLYSKGGSDNNDSRQVAADNTDNTVDKSENEPVENNIVYKEVEYAGCTFVLPDGIKASEDGDSLNYLFDDNNMLNFRFSFADIDNWADAEKKFLENATKIEGYEIISSNSVNIDNKQVYVIEMSKSDVRSKSYCVNADNKGVFIFTYYTTATDYPYEREIDTIVSSIDASGIGTYVAAHSSQNEDAIPDESSDTDNAALMVETEEQEEEIAELQEEDDTEETEVQKESESPEPVKKPSKSDLTYDEDGYIIVTYANRGKLANIDKPNVHLTGTLVDTNNMCFIIEDEDGNLWTGESAGGLDFTSYIGTECDIYGFCAGGISKRHNTPLVDMAYKDSHISFYDGLSYYPKDDWSYSQFPRWNFENEKEGGGFSVWIPTEGGTKYHSYEGCSGMENPEQVTEEEAIRRGFERCGKCW